MDYTNKQMFWYLATVAVQYSVEANKDTNTPGYVKIQTMNVLVTPTKKIIAQEVIEDIRSLSVLKLKEYYKVTEANILDIIIMNISFLGLMTEQQFFNKKAQINEQYKLN